MSRSSRLQYEPLTVAHAELLLPVLAPAEVWRHIGDNEAASLEALRDRFARMTGAAAAPPSERWINFAARLADGEYCGRLEATVHDDTWAEIAYLFGPRFWGRGLATEGVRWLCDELARRGIREVWAAVQPANAPSRRLLERLGFAVTAPSRALGSYDDGDVVYVRAG